MLAAGTHTTFPMLILTHQLGISPRAASTPLLGVILRNQATKAVEIPLPLLPKSVQSWPMARTVPPLLRKPRHPRCTAPRELPLHCPTQMPARPRTPCKHACATPHKSESGQPLASPCHAGWAALASPRPAAAAQRERKQAVPRCPKPRMVSSHGGPKLP